MSTELLLALIVCAALVVFTFLAHLAQRLLWKDTFKAMLDKNNSAVGIEYAGYFLGVMLIIASVLGDISLSQRTMTTLIDNGTLSLSDYCINIAVYGTFGILALAAFGRMGLHVILRTNIVAGVCANNTAAAIVAAAAHVSTGLVIAGSLSGENHSGSFAPIPVFMITGLLTLWLIIYLFRFITRYDDAQEITNANNAAALSYAGISIAVGMIVSHAIEGDFTDYETSFLLYGKSLLVVVLLYPVRQFIVQGILLGKGFRFYGGILDDEISQDRNVAAGTIEAAGYIAAAALAQHLGY